MTQLAASTPVSSPGLLCPVCHIDLVMMSREGVEIDYCAKCRGVWLDRGELDKIIERSASYEATLPSQRAAAQQGSTVPPQPMAAPQGVGYPGYPSHGGQHGQGGGHHGGGLLGRLFR